MPTGTCTECGQEEVPGAVPDEDQPFLCCDCDLELATYANLERTELQETTRLRLKALSQAKSPLGRRASLMDKARKVLTTRVFDPEGNRGSAVKVLIDDRQTYFAGMGATDLWPSTGPLALYLAEVIPEAPLSDKLTKEDRWKRYSVADAQKVKQFELPSKLSILELGAGAGAPGIWIWKKRSPNVKVCLTDVPRLVPLLQLSAAANSAVEGMSQQAFRWSVKEDAAAFESTGEVLDLVIGADACYNEDKSFPLMEAITRLSPIHGAVLAQSLHSEAENGGEAAISALQERAEEAGWSFQRVKVMDTGIKYCEENWHTAIIRLIPPSQGSRARKSRRSRYDAVDQGIEGLVEQTMAEPKNKMKEPEDTPAPFWDDFSV